MHCTGQSLTTHRWKDGIVSAYNDSAVLLKCCNYVTETHHSLSLQGEVGETGNFGKDGQTGSEVSKLFYT